MLVTLELWINRQRLHAASRRELTARKQVFAERLHMAKLEDLIEDLEVDMLVTAYCRENV